MKPAIGNTIKEVRLVMEVDENIVSEKPIDNTIGSRTDINEKYTLSAGQTLMMSVIATDSLGFYHKTIVDKFGLDGNADPIAEDNNIFMDIDIITDKDGNILYDPQYNKGY